MTPLYFVKLFCLKGDALEFEEMTKYIYIYIYIYMNIQFKDFVVKKITTQISKLI